MMLHTSLKCLAAACLCCLLTDVAIGQISFGVIRQNGVVTGGGFQVNGIVTNGGTGVRLGISTGTSQLIGVQNFIVQGGGNGGGGGQQVVRRQPPKPSAGMFVKATKRFDKDKDGLLNKEELNKIAVAVLAELRQRQGPPGQRTLNSTAAAEGSESPTATDEMVETFVAHCLTFDQDKDEALNPAETKRMAAALIRALS